VHARVDYKVETESSLDDFETAITTHVMPVNYITNSLCEISMMFLIDSLKVKEEIRIDLGN